MAAVTLRVAISKKELDRLRSIVEFHEKNCQGTNLKVSDQQGSGTSSENRPVNVAKTLPMLGIPGPLDKNRDQRVPKTVVEKDILVESSTEQAPEGSETAPKTARLTQSEIVETVRKRFQVKAKHLLSKIVENHETFSYKDDGSVTIFGKEIPNSDVRHLLQLTFYTIKSRHIFGKDEWFQLLKQLNLFKDFVKNPNFLEREQKQNEDDWFFLGEIAI